MEPSRPQTQLVIKHMVCRRCIQTVDRIVREAGLFPAKVALGELVLSGPLSRDQLSILKDRLERVGFEIAESETAQLISKVKSLIIDRIHHRRGDPELKLSTYLARETHTDYSRLSKLFSTTESITIERYATLQKVERVKELLAYGEMTISEIADELDYSSAAHLSAQFRQITGMSPSEFRELGNRGRRSLDSVG